MVANMKEKREDLMEKIVPQMKNGRDTESETGLEGKCLKSLNTEQLQAVMGEMCQH